ncbi:hypothetical protein [Streptomyces sp. IBSBF 2806]|uniref:hypothetical protein n=1 Tax=Streptomyces sp. IBSBF 2806 TaxID=2903529 RepID=UPI002FDB9FAC
MKTSLCFGACAHCPLAKPGGKPGLVALVPQRADVGHEFSNHVGRPARDLPVADDHCSSRVPHHTSMITIKDSTRLTADRARGR